MKDSDLRIYDNKRIAVFTASLEVTGTLQKVGVSATIAVLENASVTSLVGVQSSISFGLNDEGCHFPVFRIPIDQIQGFGEPSAKKRKK